MEKPVIENLRVLVTGATGFIGRALLPHLLEPIATSRRPVEASAIDASGACNWMVWPDPINQMLPLPRETGLDAVVHLMGEPIAEGRWTAARKQSIRDSRVKSTENLIRSLAQSERPPHVLVSASAMGFYGSRGDQELDEAACSGSDFLADVCRQWEQASLAARDLGMRVVLLRIGLVLGRGGFLSKALPVFRKGLGGKLGDGRQWTSWIHVDDLVALILHACRDPKISGPVNASTPFPVRNAELTKALAGYVAKPALLPVPKIALRLAFGEMADVLLSSIRMRPAKALACGFEFKYPEIHDALRAALSLH